VINSKVKAGRNLILEHGVTIGAEKNRCPILGDNVFVGAGAKIIGGVTAVGIPAKVIKIYGERVVSSLGRWIRVESRIDLFQESSEIHFSCRSRCCDEIGG